jgi:hypothetical protein
VLPSRTYAVLLRLSLKPPSNQEQNRRWHNEHPDDQETHEPMIPQDHPGEFTDKHRCYRDDPTHEFPSPGNHQTQDSHSPQTQQKPIRSRNWFGGVRVGCDDDEQGYSEDYDTPDASNPPEDFYGTGDSACGAY